MKINKIYKVITIIMILVISMFTFGCGESQEEKYEKLDKEYAQIIEKHIQEVHELGKLEMQNANKKEIWMKHEILLENYEKETKQKLNEMEKVAKGNKKLEEKFKIKQKKNEYAIRDVKKILKDRFNNMVIGK